VPTFSGHTLVFGGGDQDLQIRPGGLVMYYRVGCLREGETLRVSGHLANLGLAPLQSTCFIPTETVRFNLRPLNQSDGQGVSNNNGPEEDEDIIAALTKCQIWPVVLENGGLDAKMASGLRSQGQRQLFCLARAILRKSKVVVLDGVSASVDIRTDELTQRIIRKEFKDCTIISAAHRLNTIVDFDRIAVLSAGRVVELDEPETLLRREGRGFRKLYELRD
jgi:ATP-binding cassette, subfamily C (CFTR/MRP), member 1